MVEWPEKKTESADWRPGVGLAITAMGVSSVSQTQPSGLHECSLPVSTVGKGNALCLDYNILLMKKKISQIPDL